MINSTRITELITKGDIFCLATVIESSNPDAPVGWKVIVFQDGAMEGETGSAIFNERLKILAMEALTEKKRRAVEVEGNVQVFLDILSEEAELTICGAGHIAMPLARFAREVGFRVTVIDDRPDFAHPSRFPGCEVIAGDFSTTLRDMPLNPSSYIVVITRGHEHDAECLEEILPRETAYVGLIGSRRRVHFILEAMGRKGIPQKRLNEVFTPIGIPIGAESPEEIALSIAAELVCRRRKGSPQVRALRTASGGRI